MASILPCPETTVGSRAAESACPGNWQYLYSGACLCDAGFWCGCKSSNPLDCWPSDDNENWIGQYTNTSSTGEELVHARNASDTICQGTMYCPGLDDPDFCPQLCPAGNYCTTPKEIITCPEGSYCPTGSTSPRKCPRLSKCPKGEEYFRSWPLLVFVILLCAAVYLFMYWRRFSLVQKSRRRKINLIRSQSQEEGRNVITSTLDGAEPCGGPDVGSSNAVSGNTMQGTGYAKYSFCTFSRRNSGSTEILKIALEFEGLRLTLPNGGPTILSEVNGSIPPGKITAIMGPSGAGKTTFLNVMAGKVQRTGGQVRVNGELADLEEYKGIIGFVPQEDIMLPELTVEDVITHSAYMRLPQEMPAREKDAAIIDVINSLDLTGVMDSVIGDNLKRGISGGQRKRVNVAIEIVTMPSFLCLDEPTSGLDSVTSLSLVRALKGLATQGVTIVAVLHQPKYEIFELFDKVLLLGVGGCTVYLGPASDMKKYFEGLGFIFPPNANPADYCMDIVAGLVERKGHPDFAKEDLFDLWKEHCLPHPLNAREKPTTSASGEYVEVPVKGETDEDEKKPGNVHLGTDISNEEHAHSPRSRYKDLSDHMFRNMQSRNVFRNKISFFEQFRLLFYRAINQRMRTLSMVPFWMSILAGALLGVSNRQVVYKGIPSAYMEDSFFYSFFVQNVHLNTNLPTSWSQTSLGIALICIPGVEVFGLERENFFREASTGLHVTAYWLAKLLDTLLWIPFYSLIFTSLLMAFSPFYIEFYRYWLIIVMAHIGYYAVGMIVSTKVGKANRGIVALVAGLVLTFAFTGVAINYGASHVQGLFWLFFPFWNAQAFMSSEYEQRSPPYDVALLNSADSDIPHNTFDFGYDLDSSFLRNILLCFLTAFSWHFIALAFLKFSDLKKQR